MNKLIYTLLLISTITYSQQQSQRIVTGHLNYSGYDYLPGENTILHFGGKTITVNVDSINPKTTRQLLTQAGIPDSVILYTAGFGSSIVNRVELFFAFVGTIPTRTIDVCIQNAHHKYCDYAIQDGLIIPQFQNLNIEELKQVAVFIATRYPLNSFMIKPFSYTSLPHLIIMSGVRDGILADMRNIRCTSRLLDYFIDLNYQIIWYQDCDGKVKNLNRQKGWKPTPRI